MWEDMDMLTMLPSVSSHDNDEHPSNDATSLRRDPSRLYDCVVVLKPPNIAGIGISQHFAELSLHAFS